MPKHKFSELANLEQLKPLLALFNQALGIPVGILDSEGNVLAAAGWQEICLDYHLVHSAASERCRICDYFRPSDLTGKAYAEFKCRNGLMVLAFPITIAGECLATGILEQFFYEDDPPDENVFRRQAERLGFEVEGYLQALRKAPVVPRAKVKSSLDYFTTFINLISGQGLNNLKLALEVKERNHAEEALRESEEKFRSLVENASGTIYTLSGEGTFSYLSPNLMGELGYEQSELLGKSFELIVHPEDIRRCKVFLKHLIETGEKGSLEYRVRHRDGSWRWQVSSASAVNNIKGEISYFIGFARDITEQKQAAEERNHLEDQLARAQKMESLGILAGGVAHDLNNILTGLVSYPDLILLELPPDDPLRSFISTIKESGQRAANVVQDLLTLARRGVSNLDVVNLNDIVFKQLISPEFEKLKLLFPEIQFKTDLDSNLLNILGSEVHLSKTLMNLVTNATEAIPHGGCVSIATSNCYIDKPLKGYDNVEEGDYVVLTVSDDGIGIAPEDLQRIFEPFYTRKVMGRSGTGLGMAVVWGTVKDHRGYIGLESREGVGSTVNLYFPVTRKEKELARVGFSLPDCLGRGEKLLVVDDILEQREIASLLLTKLGYVVLTSASGEEAVEYLKNNSADLVILDMIMDPGIDGLVTYQRILEQHPGQKAIIVSGFAETEKVKLAQQLGAGAYVKKPYTLQRLGLAVRKELDA